MSEVELCPHCKQTMPSPGTLLCAYERCNRSFIPTDHKQIYCAPRCRLGAFRAARRAPRAPRALTTPERLELVNKTLPAGVELRDVAPEVRTLPMFSTPVTNSSRSSSSPAERSASNRKTRGKRVLSAAADQLSSRGETQRNAAPDIWVRRWLGPKEAFAHTMRRHPPADGSVVAVCGADLTDSFRTAAAVPDCGACKEHRTSELTAQGLMWSELNAENLAHCIVGHWRRLGLRSSSSANFADMSAFFQLNYPWRAFENKAFESLLSDVLLVMTRDKRLKYDANDDVYRMPGTRSSKRNR